MFRAEIREDDPPQYCSVRLSWEGVHLTASNWPCSRWLSGETVCFDCATARHKQFEAEGVARSCYQPVELNVTITINPNRPRPARRD